MTYASEVAADNPRIWWKLDETSGTTANDSSAGGTLDGTFAGSWTLNATTCPNGDPAARLTGTDYTDKVSVSFASVTPAAITLEYWVKPYTLLDYSAYMNNWDTQGIMTTTSRGGFNAGEFYSRTNPASGGPSYTSMKGWTEGNSGLYRDVLRVGEWTHMVYTNDGSVGQLYRNGRRISAVGNTNIKAATSFSVSKGDVALAHIAQYDTALSETRIRAHYDAMVGAETGLIFVGATSWEDYGGNMTWPLPLGTAVGDLVLVAHAANGDGTALSLANDGLTDSTNFGSGGTNWWGAAHGTITSGILAQGGLKPKRLDNNGTPPGSRYHAYAIAVYRNAEVISPASGNNVTVTATASGQRAVTALVGMESNDIADGWNKVASDPMEIRTLVPPGLYGHAVLWDGALANGNSYAAYPACNWTPNGNSVNNAAGVNWLIGPTTPPPPAEPTPPWSRMKRAVNRAALARAVA